jgi:hypothetical protein
MIDMMMIFFVVGQFKGSLGSSELGSCQ